MTFEEYNTGSDMISGPLTDKVEEMMTLITSISGFSSVVCYLHRWVILPCTKTNCFSQGVSYLGLLVRWALGKDIIMGGRHVVDNLWYQ